MAWSLELAIEHNRRALLAVVAGLFAYARIDDGDVDGATLPRMLRNAILRLLRPAESAARRLIFVAARAVEAPAAQLLVSSLAELLPDRAEKGALARRFHPPLSAQPTSPPQEGRAALRLPAFSLSDPPRRLGLAPRLRAAGMPRISLPGVAERLPLPVKPSPGDPVAAIRLCHRLVTLKRALEDLSGQAKRLARLDALAAARRQAEAAAGKGRTGRTSRCRLRPGKPPGCRARPRHAVDAVLTDCHALAREALHRPDTS